MEPIIDIVKQNLIHVGWAMVIFICAYVSNMAFSMYLNIKINRQPFDTSKILNSLIKIGVFIVGLLLLTTAVTTIPIFAELMRWQIPEEFSEIFSGIVIVGVVLYTSCRYAMEAFEKFKKILDSDEPI